MKPAFQANETFLKDVKTVLAHPDGRHLWWLGQSGFLIVQNGRALLLDPYLSDSLTLKYSSTDKPHVRLTELVVGPAALGTLGVIDFITSSHNHTDHLDAETLLPLLKANPNATLIAPAANRGFIIERLGNWVESRLTLVDAGKVSQVGKLEIQGIPAAHPTVQRDENGRCRFLGYVIRWEDLTFYHSGDTLWHEGLIPALRDAQVDLAMLPINGDKPERRVAGNLDGPQAARLAHDIGAACVIPCHFDLFEFNTASPETFITECQRLHQPFQILRNGEGFDLHRLKT